MPAKLSSGVSSFSLLAIPFFVLAGALMAEGGTAVRLVRLAQVFVGFIGLVTPPFGSTLFVGCAVGRVSIEEVTRSIWPFYVAMIVVLLLVTYIPAVSLWLPAQFTF